MKFWSRKYHFRKWDRNSTISIFHFEMSFFWDAFSVRNQNSRTRLYGIGISTYYSTRATDYAINAIEYANRKTIPSNQSTFPLIQWKLCHQGIPSWWEGATNNAIRAADCAIRLEIYVCIVWAIEHIQPESCRDEIRGFWSYITDHLKSVGPLSVGHRLRNLSLNCIPN